MNAVVQKVNGLNGTKYLTQPTSLNFSDHYEFRHGVKPDEPQITNLVKQDTENLVATIGHIDKPSKPPEGIPSFGNGEPPKDSQEISTIDSFADNKKVLLSLAAVFLTSSGLAVISHFTDFMDKFGETFKKGFQFVFDFISISLGTVVAAALLSFMGRNTKNTNTTFKGDYYSWL